MTYIIEVCNWSWGVEIDCYGIYEEATSYSSWMSGVNLDDYLGI